MYQQKSEKFKINKIINHFSKYKVSNDNFIRSHLKSQENVIILKSTHNQTQGDI